MRMSLDPHHLHGLGSRRCADVRICSEEQTTSIFTLTAAAESRVQCLKRSGRLDVPPERCNIRVIVKDVPYLQSGYLNYQTTSQVTASVLMSAEITADFRHINDNYFDSFTESKMLSTCDS